MLVEKVPVGALASRTAARYECWCNCRHALDLAVRLTAVAFLTEEEAQLSSLGRSAGFEMTANEDSYWENFVECEVAVVQTRRAGFAEKEAAVGELRIPN
jgi:hypothetical protein